MIAVIIIVAVIVVICAYSYESMIGRGRTTFPLGYYDPAGYASEITRRV